MAEAQTPEEDSITPRDESERENGYEGPDPETDEKGDGSDEDQGT